jgi:alpha-galactosidase
MSFPAASLPASFRGKTLAVRDLWKHGAAAMTDESFTATVPSHGVALVKISAK